MKISENGKIHYPNHAKSSYNYYKRHFPDDTIVARLILNDMLIHVCSAEELSNSELSQQDLFSLLLTALAEIHANAEMFGGINSISFKSKWKQIDRRGNKLCKQFVYDEGFCYVFCRNNLTNAQKAVQSGHALLELSKKYNIKNHPSLVYLVVKSEEKLKKVMQELIDNDINFSLFRESDMNNEITSIATEVIYGNKRELLKRYSLLT